MRTLAGCRQRSPARSRPIPEIVFPAIDPADYAAGDIMVHDPVAAPFGTDAGPQVYDVARADHRIELPGAFAIVAEFELAIGRTDLDRLALAGLQGEAAEFGSARARRRAKSRNCHG